MLLLVPTYTVRSRSCQYLGTGTYPSNLYSAAISSYHSGEKLTKVRSANPKEVHVSSINVAIRCHVDSSLFLDTATPLIHLAEKTWTWTQCCGSGSKALVTDPDPLCILVGTFLSDPCMKPTRKKNRGKKASFKSGSAEMNPDWE